MVDPPVLSLDLHLPPACPRVDPAWGLKPPYLLEPHVVTREAGVEEREEKGDEEKEEAKERKLQHRT